MYRKHLKEMELSSSSKNSSQNKTGMKTIDAISEIPVVNSALNNVTEYYGKMKKDSNLLFRTSLNLAELSVSVMSIAATPITTLCKRPIDSVDSYLCNKLHDLEHSYPTITKPTDQITATAYTQARQIYDQTLKQPIDKISNIKEGVLKMGTDSIDSIKSYSCDQLNRSAVLGVRVMDACLETSLAKMFTDPVLNFTENALDYLMPETNTTTSGSIKCTSQQGTTLKRLFDINSRVCRRLYQTTFEQLNKIHVQFEATIKKLQSLKQLSDAFYSGSRDRFVDTMQSVKQSTLVSRCLTVVNRENLSIQKIETFMKSSYRAILDDVAKMIEKYMSLVKNFPITFNGSKIRQTVDNLINQLNKESFSVILNYSIDQLKSINESLVSYTNQMFQVVNNSRIANLLKRLPSKASSKALPSNSRSTPTINTPTSTSGTKTSNHIEEETNERAENKQPETTENTTSNRTTPFTSPSPATTTTTSEPTSVTKSSSTTTAATSSVSGVNHLVPPPTPALKSSSSDSNNRASSSVINARELGENLRIVAARNDDDEEDEDLKTSSLESSGRDFEDDDLGDSSNTSNDDESNEEDVLATRFTEQPKFDDQSID